MKYAVPNSPFAKAIVDVVTKTGKPMLLTYLRKQLDATPTEFRLTKSGSFRNNR